jgi:hypothetical protein
MDREDDREWTEEGVEEASESAPSSSRSAEGVGMGSVEGEGDGMVEGRAMVEGRGMVEGASGGEEGEVGRATGSAGGGELMGIETETGESGREEGEETTRSRPESTARPTGQLKLQKLKVTTPLSPFPRAPPGRSRLA